MENAIVYSTAGASQLLVAVPEHKDGMVGAYEWSFPETPGVNVSQVGKFKVPDNSTELFDHITVYRMELTTADAVQPFNMMHGAYLPPGALVQGVVQMISHPTIRTIHVHAAMPVERTTGGLPYLLLVPVVDQSGSTGYHWEQSPLPADVGLKVQSWLFPSEKPMPGAPATRIFAISSAKVGIHQVQFTLVPPGRDAAPVASIAVTFDAGANTN